MRRFALVLMGALATGGGVEAQTPAKAPPPPVSPTTGAVPQSAQPAMRMPGYLGKDGVPDAIAILPPPPLPGSPQANADHAIFMATRQLRGSARWTLAARDAVNYLGAFECPLGIVISQATTPKLVKLLSRTGMDASVMTSSAKDHYGVHRPVWDQTQPICVEDQRAGLMKSPSYPSGHQTFSWAAGLILAEIAPDKATEILGRARAFGESRVACGVHFLSDIEEGRTAGSALVAALHADPDFQADLTAAKVEVAAARTAPHAALDAGECKIEADAEKHTPWINPTEAK